MPKTELSWLVFCNVLGKNFKRRINKKINVSEEDISKMLNGDYKLLDFVMLGKIASALGCKLDVSIVPMED